MNTTVWVAEIADLFDLEDMYGEFGDDYDKEGVVRGLIAAIEKAVQETIPSAIVHRDGNVTVDLADKEGARVIDWAATANQVDMVPILEANDRRTR